MENKNKIHNHTIGMYMSEFLIRNSLGIVFIMFAVGKFFIGITEFSKILSNGYGEQALISPMIAEYFAYAIPYIELILGVWLISGLYRVYALFSTGILMLVYMFGHLAMPDMQTIPHLYIYLFAIVIALCLPSYCLSNLFNKKPTKENDSCCGSC